MQEYWSRSPFLSPMSIPRSFLNEVKCLLIGELKSFATFQKQVFYQIFALQIFFPVNCLFLPFLKKYLFMLHQVLVVAHRIQWGLQSLF